MRHQSNAKQDNSFTHNIAITPFEGPMLTPVPSLHSKIHFSNRWYILCLWNACFIAEMILSAFWLGAASTEEKVRPVNLT